MSGTANEEDAADTPEVADVVGVMEDTMRFGDTVGDERVVQHATGDVLGEDTSDVALPVGAASDDTTFPESANMADMVAGMVDSVISQCR